MAADSDVLLAYWQEQRTHARHTEDQRATLTNLILIISAATLGFLSQWGWTLRSLSITVPLIFLGLYGAVASEKLYERNLHHHRQAGAFSRLLSETTGAPDHDEALQDVRRDFAAEHPVMHRLRLYMLWITLHVMIALLGVVLSIALIVTHNR